jgi:peptidoglycan/xylan/chitin deacetylase (PgdA/CDA1 family)
MFAILKIAIISKLKRLVVILSSFIVVYSGLMALVGILRKIKGRRRITILGYHEVGEGSGLRASTYMSQSEFERHVIFLKKNLRLVSIDEIFTMLKNGFPPKEDCVAITFDDGSLSIYQNALPILLKYNIPATVFVTSGFTDQKLVPWWSKFDFLSHFANRGEFDLKRNNKMFKEVELIFNSFLGRVILRYLPQYAVEYIKRKSEQKKFDLNAIVDQILDGQDLDLERSMMNWGEVKKMRKYGIAIGGHTVSHPILTSISQKEWKKEIDLCKARIEEMIGEAPKYFAYPVGLSYTFNEEIKSQVAIEGFKAAVTMIHGCVNNNSDMYALPRKGVAKYPMFVLKANISGILDKLYF